MITPPTSMNRNSLTSLAVLFLLAPAAFAQSGVVAVHPASNPDGKLLTMEDATVSSAVRPANLYARWIDNDTYSAYMDGDWKFFNLSGKEVDRKDLKVKPEPTQALTRDAAHRTPSPAGAMAYTRGRSLYCMDAGGNEVTVAESENDQITYGQSVSRNEFGINGGVFWSPSGSRIAFYRKDESKVTDFPLLDITTRTGTLQSIKYPMNGMDSEVVSLGIYDLQTGKTCWADVTDFNDDRYLTNISWSPDDKYVFIQVLDRTQKHCRLNQYRADDGAFVRTILTEDNPRFTEPLDPIRFLKGEYEFIYRTDNRDGYRNLYLCDTLGNVRRLYPDVRVLLLAGMPLKEEEARAREGGGRGGRNDLRYHRISAALSGGAQITDKPTIFRWVFVVYIRCLISVDKKRISLFQRIFAIFFIFCTAAVSRHCSETLSFPRMRQ